MRGINTEITYTVEWDKLGEELACLSSYEQNKFFKAFSQCVVNAYTRAGITMQMHYIQSGEGQGEEPFGYEDKRIYALLGGKE